MDVARTPADMSALADDARRAGRRIALVPTMGALHAGHASLLDEGRRRSDVLVLSIFVNPLQFGPNEDLSRYPSTPESDLAQAQQSGVDILYLPTPGAMYPPGYQTTITVSGLEEGMCGAQRPGHFRGVATVVCKLFTACKPHLALFGNKDYQQLQIIRCMARDLDLGVDVVGMPIVREPDGLAMSSRNVYLSSEERARSLAVSRALRAVERAFEAGERDGVALLSHARAELFEGIASADLTLEYLDLRDTTSLVELQRVEQSAVVAIAVRVGKTRLIDNTILTVT